MPQTRSASAENSATLGVHQGPDTIGVQHRRHLRYAAIRRVSAPSLSRRNAAAASIDWPVSGMRNNCQTCGTTGHVCSSTSVPAARARVGQAACCRPAAPRSCRHGPAAAAARPVAHRAGRRAACAGRCPRGRAAARSMPGAVEHRVPLGVGPQRLPGAGQVGPGREQQGRGGHRVPGVTQGQQQRQAQAAARGVAADHDLSGRDAARQQPAIGLRRVVHRRRERMLRRQAVVRGEHVQPAAGEPGRDRPVSLRRAREVAAAVQIEQRARRVAGIRAQPLAGHAAHRFLRGAHARRHLVLDRAERGACLVDVRLGCQLALDLHLEDEDGEVCLPACHAACP